jgi:tetratricopeptide (TPR) repeat protein
MPVTWTEEGLVAHFRDIHTKMPNRSFSFVLGAGASFTSGIKTASFFARTWLNELHVREGRGASYEDWLRDGVNIPGFDADNPAASYPEVFVRRFGDDPEEGYAWLEDTMRGAVPSIGYLVLARVLAETRHRIVITTNFDNLVAEALAMTGAVHPLVVGHESLAGFASTSPRRPLIAKIHRDLLLAPVNDPSGTSQLPRDWAAALSRILAQHTPIFLGYGGNDGSLMDFLSALPEHHMPGRPVWCHWYREAPSARICALMDHLGGVLVAIRDFDELMMRLNEVLGFGMPIERVAAHAERMVQRCRNETSRVLEKLAATAAPDSTAVRASVEKTEGAIGWVMRARMTSDPAQRVPIYEEGLRAFPDSAELIAGLASAVRELGDVDAAEAIVRGALDRGVAQGRDRGLLHGALGRLLASGPVGIEALAQFEAAYALAPREPDVLRPFADFLVFRDVLRAEALYRAAIEVTDGRDADALCNYAVLLLEQRRDLEGADVFFARALELNPEDGVSLSNAAEVALLRGQHDRALELARSLWVASAADPTRRAVAAVLAGLATRLGGLSDDEPLGRLKGLLPLARPTRFSFAATLDALAGQLEPEVLLLYRTIAAVVEGAPAEALATVDAWGQVDRIHPDARWEDA